MNPPNPWTVNVMEMEFTVYPAGIGNERGIKFDITRQAEGKRWDDGIEVISVRRSFPAQDESPNDDIGQKDEDNDPTNDHIYSTDAVGWVTSIALCDESVIKGNFYEFVRVRLDGTRPTGDAIEGSRCSSKIAWRSLLALVGPPAEPWTRINRNASATAPTPDPKNKGNGQIINIQTNDDATVTEDWTVTCIGNNKWKVRGSKTGTHAQATTGVPYASKKEEIEFTIRAGTKPFAVGDKFTFSTKGARINEIELGHRPIPSGV